MSKIRAIIVDDEAPARELIRYLLEKYPFIELTGLCPDGQSAINLIREEQPDLLFLDIQMPEINGFEVLRAIPQVIMPYTIFTTAYDQYAIQAFEVNAIDYLLKPFDDDRFERAVQKAQLAHQDRANRAWSNQVQQLLGGLHLAPKNDYLRKLSVKVGNKIKFIPVEQVIWIEAENQYVRIHTAGTSYLQRQSLQHLETLLSPEEFYRIHRSALVCLNAIRQIEPYFKGDYTVYLEGGAKVKLSRNRVDGLREIFKW